MTAVLVTLVVLIVLASVLRIWEAAGYPWSVRLQALLPTWLPSATRRWRISRDSPSGCGR